ncbi:hypothetical protein ACIQBJ_32400 [Kitasatospora sp. NPDC088391]|uniref:hypothetical protein n=1 Tax=Kitasatospora sp. NPDC088391 TaxID=3364074 RepID=UPI0037F5BADD
MASDDLDSDWAAWLDAEFAGAEAAALRGHRRAVRLSRARLVVLWAASVALASGLGFALVWTAQHGPAPRPAVSTSPTAGPHG